MLIWKKCQDIDQKGIRPRLKLLDEPFMTLVEPLPEKEEAPKKNPVILSQHIEHTIRGMRYATIRYRNYSEVDPKSHRELQTHIKIRAGIR